MHRFYADENFPKPVVEELRNLGHDVLRAQEVGNAGRKIPDPDVLNFAISQDRAVLTRNRWDFIKLHTQIRPHTGIIVCSDDADFSGQAVRIHQAVSARPVLDDQLIRIDLPQTP